MLREEFRFQCSIHPRTPKPAHMPSFADPRWSSFTNIAPFFRFSGSRGPPIAPRSPRSFLADGAVGLGIVPAIAADPEAVAIARADTVSEWGEKPPEEISLCESYTCVRSYMGGRPVSKRIYYEDGDGGIVGEFRGDKIALFELQPPLPAEPPFHVAKLFGRCFRCRMELDGLDIYVYRGDKAFCSMECRCQQMVIDELTEKFTEGSKRKHESSMSPCTAPSLFAAKAIKDYKV